MAASGVSKVLVVDDDPDVLDVLRASLSDHGYVVVEATSGRAALAQAEEHKPDVVLLDLGLPDLGGLEVLIDLTRRSGIPVIVVTGRSSETDTVVGLELGADDYIAKPFSERELLARVDAALRRVRSREPDEILASGGLTIDIFAREVTVDGRLVELTPKEFDLLLFLARSPRRVFSRGQLLEHVWGSSASWQNDSTVAEHVYRIRRKLDKDLRARWIETVRGVGYRFGPRSLDASPGNGADRLRH